MGGWILRKIEFFWWWVFRCGETFSKLMMDCGLKKYIYKKNSIALFCSLVFLGGLILFFFSFFNQKTTMLRLEKYVISHYLSLSIVMKGHEILIVCKDA